MNGRLRFSSRLPLLCLFYLAPFALLLLAPMRGHAQLLQGTIDGNVTDSSQAAIVGASVTAQEQGTGFTRNAKTNTQGEFTLATLPPGSYTITVKNQGFQTYTKTGIVVSGNNITRANIVLTIGQLTQKVTVSAQASALQTDRADVHTNLNAQTLTDLPSPLGRNYQMILPAVVPGVSTPQGGGSVGANPSRAVFFSVNGASSATNNTRIDGASSTNFNRDAPMYTPALAAIQTVNVVTNSFDPEQGLAGGAAISVITKSGTNNIHGSLFEFHTDQHLQAYPWAGNRNLPKPKYINNQYGGTIGGPIKKGKLFYFVSYQGTSVPLANPVVSTVPTAVMKTGDLSDSPTPIYDPVTGNSDGTGRVPFSGNIIPQNRIDPGIASLLALNEWPNPNQPGTGSLGLTRNYQSTGDSGEDQRQWDTKLSWNLGNKLSMFARLGLNRFSWSNPQQYGPLGGPGVSPTNSAVGTGEGSIYSGTLSGTYIFSPNLIADAYYGYSRNDSNSSPEHLDKNLGWTLLGIPGLESSETREGGLPALEIDGFGGKGINLPEATLGLNNNFQPQIFHNLQREWAGNVTGIIGTHTLRGGIDFTQEQINENFEQATFCSFCTGAGGFEFSQGTTQLNGGPPGNDYNAFAAFLLGLPTEVGKVTLIPPEYKDYSDILAFYIQDQWQASHKLTVTYGTRWAHYPFPTRGDRGMEYLDAQSNEMIICGVAGNPKNCGITKDTRRFAPRAGIAYRLTSSTVFRVGYGISIDPSNFGATLGNRQNYPDIVATTLTAPNAFSYATTFRIGIPPVIAPDYATGRVAVPTSAGVFTVDNDNYVRGYIESWNATLEQKLGNWVVSAGYVASRSIDPVISLDENWSPIGTGTAGQVLNVLSGRTAITDGIGTEGTAKYDSLQARVDHRFAHNYQFSGTYTFAKGLGYSTQVAIPYDFGLNYGNIGGLARNTLGLTVIADSPFGHNKRWLQSGIAGRILGNWQLQAVSTLRSGTPFTVTASSTTLNAIGSGQFADCVSKPQEVSNIYEWYNPSAFAEPTAGRFGTCGTNNLWGPALINLDMGLARTFNLSERFQLKFRVEMFNAANTPHHSNPSSNINSSSFMEALGIAETGRNGIDQRTTQLSLRLGW